jgi:hypothetical protein
MQFINKKKRQDQKKREKEIQVWACQELLMTGVRSCRHASCVAVHPPSLYMFALSMAPKFICWAQVGTVGPGCHAMHLLEVSSSEHIMYVHTSQQNIWASLVLSPFQSLFQSHCVVLSRLVDLQELEAAVHQSVTAHQAQIEREFEELAMKGGQWFLGHPCILSVSKSQQYSSHSPVHAEAEGMFLAMLSP